MNEWSIKIDGLMSILIKKFVENIIVEVLKFEEIIKKEMYKKGYKSFVLIMYKVFDFWGNIKYFEEVMRDYYMVKIRVKMWLSVVMVFIILDNV